MSYDIRLGVKVAGGDNLYAVIAEPIHSSPTYNIGEMFRVCMGWDFKQGEWYRVSEVLPLIENGIHELRYNEKAYIKYNASNGWGNTYSALRSLESLEECIRYNSGSGWGWNEIPLSLLYVTW